MSKEVELYNEDGMKITATRDPQLVNHHNTGFCAIPFTHIKNRTIKDIWYENTYFERDGEYELDVTFIVIWLEKVDYSPIDRLIVQQDPEGNGGGYIGFIKQDGSEYFNEVEGIRAREKRQEVKNRTS